jgi:type IV pilus assembly protein PilM
MQLRPFRKRNYIGLDIGHSAVKLAQVERTSNGWRVTKCHTLPTPPDTIRDGIIIDPPMMAATIKQLLREAGVGSCETSIAVAGGSVVVRTVRIPKMAEATLRKSIKYEAGRYVPTSVDDSYIEFEIIRDSTDNQMDVLIVAAPREIVETRIAACDAAGLEVEGVDVEAFATYRALVEADPDGNWNDSTIALVDIGSMTTNVSVVAQGVFAMTRAIPQGGATLTEALKTYFKLSDEDAERGKYELDFRELIRDDLPIENPPLRVLQPHADELVREIRRSLNYYQSQQTEAGGGNPVSQMLISGGGARMRGLSDYFSHRLGLPVSALGVFDNPRFVPDSVLEPSTGLDLAVASGLAMRAFPKAA